MDKYKTYIRQSEARYRRYLSKKIIPRTRQFRQKAAPLLIGMKTENNTPALISQEDRNRHMYVVGASGTGKSYFLQSLIQQDIDGGEGCCVVDPHGELYENLVNYCANKKILHKRVVLFNPSDFNSSYVMGFNPLAKLHPNEDINVKADKFIEIVKRIMSQDDQTQPMIESTLRNCLIPLIKGGHTLLEIERFFDFSQNQQIVELAKEGERSSIMTFWNNYTKMSVREKEFRISGVQRRIEKFVETQAVRLSVGQIKRNLDLKDIVENRKILLVNLSTAGNLISNENAHLLGTLLVNSFLSYGFNRNIKTAKKRPFYLYMDEFQDFVTSDVNRILTGGRKFGIHLILANQKLSDIEDETIQEAVQDANVQVVFRVKSYKTANILAHNLGSHFNLMETKYTEKRPYFEPILEKRSTQSRSQTEGFGGGHSKGQSSGSGTRKGQSIDTASKYQYPTISNQSMEQISSTTSDSTSFNRSSSTSHNEQWVTNHIKQIMEIPHFYSLPEHYYRLCAEIQNQPNRQALVQIEGGQHFQIKTLDVTTPHINSKKLNNFKQMVRWSHNCYLPKKAALRQIEYKPQTQPTPPQRARKKQAIVVPTKTKKGPQNPFA